MKFWHWIDILGADYCRQGHECHGNASCINLRTEFLCQCNPGFYGDGKNCTGMFLSIDAACATAFYICQ